MAVKELLHRLQPVQIYLVLVLSIVYFCVQLFLSHVTHALTLLICAYHMLCNIVALTGCIITIKVGRFRSIDRTNALCSLLVARLYRSLIIASDGSGCIIGIVQL